MERGTQAVAGWGGGLGYTQQAWESANPTPRLFSSPYCVTLGKSLSFSQFQPEGAGLGVSKGLENSLFLEPRKLRDARDPRGHLGEQTLLLQMKKLKPRDHVLTPGHPSQAVKPGEGSTLWGLSTPTLL